MLHFRRNRLDAETAARVGCLEIVFNTGPSSEELEYLLRYAHGSHVNHLRSFCPFVAAARCSPAVESDAFHQLVAKPQHAAFGLVVP